jgi:DNA-binding protein H-NS
MATNSDLEAMPIEKLLDLYERIRLVLTTKMLQQKKALDAQLRLLNQTEIPPSAQRIGPALALRKAKTSKPAIRAPYPKVYPIYRNPDNPSETWSGRGLRPKWLATLISTGKQIEDFRIASARPTSASKTLRSKKKRDPLRGRPR